MTYQQAIEQIRKQHSDITEAEIYMRIRNAYAELAEEAYTTEEEIILYPDGSTAELTLPSNVVRIHKVKINNEPVPRLPLPIQSVQGAATESAAGFAWNYSGGQFYAGRVGEGVWYPLETSEYVYVTANTIPYVPAGYVILVDDDTGVEVSQYSEPYDNEMPLSIVYHQGIVARVLQEIKELMGDYQGAMYFSSKWREYVRKAKIDSRSGLDMHYNTIVREY